MREQSTNAAGSSKRRTVGALFAALLLAFSLSFTGVASLQEAWAAPTESAIEAEAPAEATTAADEAAAEGEAVEEEIIEDDDVPLGVRRTVAIGHNLKPLLAACVVIAVIGFGSWLLRVNRNIDKMNHRLR